MLRRGDSMPRSRCVVQRVSGLSYLRHVSFAILLFLPLLSISAYAQISGTMRSDALGFDTTAVPDPSTMNTWWQYSPYSDIAVYLGGCNVTSEFVRNGVPIADACGNQQSDPYGTKYQNRNINLATDWVNAVYQQGWGIIPLWVGPQATCADAASQYWQLNISTSGTLEADAAVARANELGISNGIIYYDMEPYDANNASCAAAVRLFLQNWVIELGKKGFKAGLYGHSRNVDDFKNIQSPRADSLWLTVLDGSTYQIASINNISALVGSYWMSAPYGAIQQYCFDTGNQQLWYSCSNGNPPGNSWNNVPLRIDGNVEVAPIVAFTNKRELPAPLLQSPANTAPNQSVTPRLSWAAVNGALFYTVAIGASASAFPLTYKQITCTACLYSTTTVSPFVDVPAGVLAGSATYYWSVHANTGVYKGGDWSPPFSFSVGTGQAVAPNVNTTTASLITSTSATLNGTVNPNGAATTYYFQYSVTNGSWTNSTTSLLLSASTTVQNVNASVASLSPNTTYYFRIVATNSAGTAYGDALSFTTTSSSVAPTVSTTVASSLTSTSAILNGLVTPNGAATTYYFQYGLTSANLNNATPSQSAGSGVDAMLVSASVTSLSPSTTYYFRLVATNAGGVNTGSVQSFITTATTAPTVSTTPATSVTATSAILNGTVNPNGTATTYYFQYGTTSSSLNTATTSLSAGSAFGVISVSASLASLAPSTTYYFRLVATNSGGTNTGTVQSFMTPAQAMAPTVATTPATSVSATGGVMNGTVNANGLTTSVWFEWGTSYALGSSTPPGTGSGTITSAWSATLMYAGSATTYYYRIVASNSSGTSYGSVVNFTTLAVAPVVATVPATNVAMNSATLNGTVNPNGAATTFYFEYATGGNGWDHSTPPQSAGSGTAPIAVSATISSLSSNTTYYFRLIAANDGGTIYAGSLSFTTAVATYAVFAGASPEFAGSVRSTDGQINCPTIPGCFANYSSGSSITLTASNNPGYVFSGWTGGCLGQGSTCALSVNGQVINTTALFDPIVSVVKIGTGTGMVTSSDGVIDCGVHCSSAYHTTQWLSVVFTAVAGPGSEFSGWTGCDSVDAHSCTISILHLTRSPTVIFNALRPPRPVAHDVPPGPSAPPYSGPPVRPPRPQNGDSGTPGPAWTGGPLIRPVRPTKGAADLIQFFMAMPWVVEVPGEEVPADKAATEGEQPDTLDGKQPAAKRKK